jgi:two-component sensor histidine kinase
MWRVRDHLRDLLPADDIMICDAIQVADELVSNALRHGLAPRTCRVTVQPDLYFHIEVEDAAPRQPRIRRPDVSGGRGLIIVDRLATTWGTVRSLRYKTVWARLALHSRVHS